ncbi:hypothetical protein AAW00_00235 [Aurantiacibacter luteus]|uniref:MobA-like NTP transferase domain-containing protein n=2 Tax=Aurantiacibacter luteus TaxID=1581420 RepID=A0A0G9MWK0_9SPHN|nr:hypothetical protein AAW00_00235 [Aurantiacibacter luteus]
MHLCALLAGEGAAATDHAGRAGVPAFVPYDLLDPLARLEGKSGAGAFLSSLPDLRLVSAPPGTLADVDRPEDLQAVAEALARRIA